MDRVSAAIEWKDGKIYLFGGSEYVRVDPATNGADPGYPQSILPAWPGLFDRDIDAAILWINAKAYFFKGDEYIRYDVAGDKADPGYPKKINDSWRGVFERDIDAAVLWSNAKAYFFKGDEYIRYDVAGDKADPGYPQKIEGSWPNLFTPPIDAAANWGTGRVVFLKGDEFLLYDKNPERAGSPQPIPSAWFGSASKPGSSDQAIDSSQPISPKPGSTARREYVIKKLLPSVLPSAYGQPMFTKLTFGLTKDNPNVTPGYTTCGSLPQYIASQLKDQRIRGTNGVRIAGKEKGAWVVADGTNRPLPGDIYALLNKNETDVMNGGIAHVGVIVDASGDEWTTADAGQGDGWAADYVTRKYDPQANTLTGEIVKSGGARPPRVLAGWIDLDAYPFLEDPSTGR
ncbi:MAG: hemopexin repeat-containing protein [Syntrophales bacterium]